MKGLWQKMNYRVRDQLLWSSIPMLLLALLALGFGSWALLGRQFTRTSLHHRGHELAYFRQGAMDRAAGEALAAALAASRDVMREQAAGSASSSLIVAVLPAVGVSRTDVPDRLEDWWRRHRKDESHRGVMDFACNRVEIMPPVVLKLNPGGDPASLLPVMVSSTGSAGVELTDGAVYFLDLQRLLAMSNQGFWWCALDPQGVVVAASDNSLSPGMPLASAPRTTAPGPLTEMTGNKLLSDLRRAGTEQAAQGGGGPVGLRCGSWLMAMDQGNGPFRILIGTPARDLQAMISRYTAIGLLLGLLAIFLASVGIVRVVGRSSGRLYTLGRALRAVARGELDRRVEVTRWDEVGTLVGYFNSMADDLREQHQLARRRTSQLRSSLEDLKRLDFAKQEFLTLVSHEVRTPLTAIKGGLEYLSASIKNVSPAEKQILDAHNLPEILEIIEKNTARLGGFMNDATLMANIQSLHKRLTVSVVPVQEVVKEILVDHAESMDRLGLEVQNGFDQRSGWNLLGDMEMLRIALEKVIDNAVIHNIPGGRLVIREVDAVPGLGAPDVLRGKLGNAGQGIFENDQWENHPVSWRLVEIFNTGRPIPADRRQALFAEFELVDPISNHQRGTGLSMPIVKTALERHGGGIFVSCRESEGNSFFLLMPTVDHAVAGRVKPLVNLWDDPGQGPGSLTWDEDIDAGCQKAVDEVELADRSAGAVSLIGQACRGLDHACGSDHEQDSAL